MPVRRMGYYLRLQAYGLNKRRTENREMPGGRMGHNSGFHDLGQAPR